ncbi:MAG TPA: hypothetical protein VFX30_01580 [bacterium]|nr:hypothetical protein [bacterium]
MTTFLNMPLTSVLQSFRGGGYDVLIHVPQPDPSALKTVAERYSPIAGFRVAQPRIEDEARGVVKFLEFGGEERRGPLEAWLEAEYGWKAFPRPLRTEAAYRNASASDFAADTEKVFAALRSLGWNCENRNERIGVGLHKPGTAVTDFSAVTQDGRVAFLVAWQVSWATLTPRVPNPNWVLRTGGTKGNPTFEKSRFSTLELAVRLLQEEDRLSLGGFDVLRQGLLTFLSPLAAGNGAISLGLPGESASEFDWPGCALEFTLRQP